VGDLHRPDLGRYAVCIVALFAMGAYIPPGAVPIQLRDLETWLDEMTRDRETVFRRDWVEIRRHAERLDLFQICLKRPAVAHDIRSIAYDDGMTIARIPYFMCLSVETLTRSEDATMLRQSVLNDPQCTPALGLVFALMHELNLGTKSDFQGYSKSMSLFKEVPLLWSNLQKGFLTGTDCGWYLNGQAEVLSHT
jgi:hypothetical protein